MTQPPQAWNRLPKRTRGEIHTCSKSSMDITTLAAFHELDAAVVEMGSNENENNQKKRTTCRTKEFWILLKAGESHLLLSTRTIWIWTQRTVEDKERRNQGIRSPGKSVGAKRGEEWGPEITKKAGRTHRVFLPKEAQRKEKSWRIPHSPEEEQWPEANPWPNFCSKTKGQCRPKILLLQEKWDYAVRDWRPWSMTTRNTRMANNSETRAHKDWRENGIFPCPR